ncbi:MAG: hypothetical protein J6X78_05060 [Treponema sp.]|nr:hypothetical protein [Treponema sp.]
MRNSLRKFLSILICLCIALVMTGCGDAFKNEGTVSIDVGSIYAAAVKASREAGDIVSEQEQEITGIQEDISEGVISEQEQPVYEEDDPDNYDDIDDPDEDDLDDPNDIEDDEEDDNEEKYNLIDESLIVQAKITVTLSGEGYEGKTKSDTLKIPLSKFDALDDEESESEDDVAKILGIKNSFLTFNDIPIGSVITAHVELDTAIVINNEAKLKQELKQVFIEEYVDESKTNEELEEEIEAFIEWYMEDMIYDSFSFGNLKGEGDSLPKVIAEGKNEITVELSMEEKEKPETNSSIKLNFKFNDGDGNYVAKTAFPSIETESENFMTDYFKALTGITLAGYQLNEEESEFKIDDNMSLSEIMKLFKETKEITFYFDKETSELPETFTIKFFFKGQDGKYIQKEGFPDKKFDLSDSDYEEQYEKYAKETDPSEDGLYTINKELSGPIYKTIAAYLEDDITELKLYYDPVSSPQEQKIPIEVNLTGLPIQSDESVVCHVDLYLMEETTFAALKKAQVTDYAEYFADKSKYASVTNIAYDRRVDSNGNDLFTLSPDETNKLILNVKDYYYPQIYEGGFNKQEDDDAGIVAIVYYGNPVKNKSSPQSLTKAYVGFAGPFTLSSILYTADLEMQALTSIPARVFVSLDGQYAYDYNNPQSAYMNGYVGFDYAIPAYDSDILNQSYTSEFCTEMLNQDVLQKYLNAGYTLKNITLNRVDFGIPVIELNFVSSAVQPTNFTFKYLFKNSTGSYVSLNEFPNSVYQMSTLLQDGYIANVLKSSLKNISMAGYEINEDKSLLYSEYDGFASYVSAGYSELTFYCDPINKVQEMSVNGHSKDATDEGNYCLKIYKNYSYEILYSSSADADELLVSTGTWYPEDANGLGDESNSNVIFYETKYYDLETEKMKDAPYSAQHQNVASKITLTSGSGKTFEFEYKQEQEQKSITLKFVLYDESGNVVENTSYTPLKYDPKYSSGFIDDLGDYIIDLVNEGYDLSTTKNTWLTEYLSKTQGSIYWPDVLQNYLIPGADSLGVAKLYFEKRPAQQGKPKFTINISVVNPKETLKIQQAVAEDDSSLTLKAVDSANTKYELYVWGDDDNQTSSEESGTFTLDTSSWKSGDVHRIYLVATDANGVSHALTLQIEKN